MSNYYEILEIEKTASADEIKKSYRRLAMKYHPDKNPGDATAEIKFREVTKAYQVLSDPDKKAQFDKYGRVFDDNQGFSGGDATSFFEDIFGDVFGGIFGGAGRRSNPDSPRRGSNISEHLTITFEEAVFGVEKEITVSQLHTCEACGGAGAEPEGMQSCSTCGGTGMHVARQGFFTMQTTCPTCGGIGKIIKEKCSECSGAGYHSEKKKLNVKIPAGIEDSMAIRVGGEGNEGVNGGPNGDLIVSISVKPHKYYRREGNHLILDLPLTFVDAVLGKKVSVHMLDGTYKELDIKSGTQFGDSIVLKGEGAPDVHGRGRGNLIISLNIMLPAKLNDAQKKAFEELRKVSDDNMYKNNKSLWQRMKDLFSQD